MKKIAAIILVALITATTAFSADVSKHLQDVSVTITTGNGSGSGVLFTRTNSNKEVLTFIWTAAHVVADQRTEREVITAAGSKKTLVEFKDVQMVKNVVEDGRIIGRLTLDAEVLKYSDADNGEDLALLKVRKKNYINTTVVFVLDREIPGLGAELYHVGSLKGSFGANSMTAGIYSQVGRILDKKVFDQTTCTAFPGSSGGGVYLKDGRYVGMLVRGAGETFNLIVPIRRIQDWTSKHNLQWALDPKVPMPSDADLLKIPVE
ncbi:MAG: serine protease [Nitrosomonadaceae bacterium]|nr:serine protease [Nitrosomonadaceae bacterium]